MSRHPPYALNLTVSPSPSFRIQTIFYSIAWIILKLELGEDLNNFANAPHWHADSRGFLRGFSRILSAFICVLSAFISVSVRSTGSARFFTLLLFSILSFQDAGSSVVLISGTKNPPRGGLRPTKTKLSSSSRLVCQFDSSYRGNYRQALGLVKRQGWISLRDWDGAFLPPHPMWIKLFCALAPIHIRCGGLQPQTP